MDYLDEIPQDTPVGIFHSASCGTPRHRAEKVNDIITRNCKVVKQSKISVTILDRGDERRSAEIVTRMVPSAVQPSIGRPVRTQLI